MWLSILFQRFIEFATLHVNSPNVRKVA